MASTSTRSSRVAFFPEVTHGLATTDWANDGKLMDHTVATVEVVDGVSQTLVKNQVLDIRPFNTGTETYLKGIRNCSAKWGGYLHGSGVVTASGSQIALTDFMTLLAHCLGGIHRSNSTTCTGGSATAPELTAVTNIIPGCYIGFEDITSPIAKNTGVVHVRRVVSIAALVVTLDEALPFTPANTDKVHGMATIYPSEARFDMSDPVQTFSLFMQGHLTDTSKLWELTGCAGSLGLSFPRNDGPQWEINWLAADWKQGNAEGGLTAPSWAGTPYGFAPLVVGRKTALSLGTYGTTTLSPKHLHSFELEVGYQATRDESITEYDDRVGGMARYTIDLGSEPNCTIVTSSHSDQWEEDLQDDLEVRIRYAMVAEAGKVWAVAMPRAQHMANPKAVDQTGLYGNSLKFVSRPPTDTSGGSNADLEQARIAIVIG